MLRVLFWGHDPNTPVPYFRGGMFEPFWPQNGVMVRTIRQPDFSDGEPVRELLDWAEVVVFRRWYVDPFSAWAWETARDRRRVYDTDDWDLGTRPDNPRREVISRVRPLIEQMLREADVVTVASPGLAKLYGTYNRRVVLIRNAVDLTLYAADTERSVKPLTALFYGTAARLRDLFGFASPGSSWEGGYAYEAVRAARLRTVWLGDEGIGPRPKEFDEVIPYTYDMRAFFRSLGNAHADIGLAPLRGDLYDSCKSELHWLEYTAAGVPVVAERMMAGPYAVIRNGVDGLLARGRTQWAEAVRSLVASASLRHDLVAAARERLRIEYDPECRSYEWADVFRGAA